MIQHWLSGAIVLTLWLLLPFATSRANVDCIQAPRLPPRRDCEEILRALHQVFSTNDKTKLWGRIVSHTDELNVQLPIGYQMTKLNDWSVNKHCEVHVDNHIMALESTAMFGMLDIERAGWEIMYHCYPSPYFYTGKAYPDIAGTKNVYVTTLWVPSSDDRLRSEMANRTIIYLDPPDAESRSNATSVVEIT